MQETEIENDSSGKKVKTEPSKEMAEETLSVHDESADAVINDTSNNIADDELDEEVAAAAKMPSESIESERNMVEIPLDCLNIE